MAILDVKRLCLRAALPIIAATGTGCSYWDYLRPDWETVDPLLDFDDAPIPAPGPHTFGGPQPEWNPRPDPGSAWDSPPPLAALSDETSNPGFHARIWNAPPGFRTDRWDHARRLACLTEEPSLVLESDDGSLEIPEETGRRPRLIQAAGWIRLAASGLYEVEVTAADGSLTQLNLGGFALLPEGAGNARRKTLHVPGDGRIPVIDPMEILVYDPVGAPFTLEFRVRPMKGGAAEYFPPRLYDERPPAVYRTNGRRAIFETLDEVPFPELAFSCKAVFTAPGTADQLGEMQERIRLHRESLGAGNADELEALRRTASDGLLGDPPDCAGAIGKMIEAIDRLEAVTTRKNGADAAVGEMEEISFQVAVSAAFRLIEDARVVLGDETPEVVSAQDMLDRLAHVHDLDPLRTRDALGGLLRESLVLQSMYHRARALWPGESVGRPSASAPEETLGSPRIEIVPFVPNADSPRSRTECGGFVGRGISNSADGPPVFFADVSEEESPANSRRDTCNAMRESQRRQLAEAPVDEARVVFRVQSALRPGGAILGVRLHVEGLAKEGCSDPGAVYFDGEVPPQRLDPSTGEETPADSYAADGQTLYLARFPLADWPEEDFTFCNLYHQRIEVALELSAAGQRISADRAEMRIFSLTGLLELYDYLARVVVRADARVQGEANPPIREDWRMHPMWPVLMIGRQKAVNYSLGLQRDWALGTRNFADPCWLASVGLYLELYTGMGILTGLMGGQYLDRPLASAEVVAPILRDFGHPTLYRDPEADSALWRWLVENVGSAGPEKGRCFWEGCQFEPVRRVILGAATAWPQPPSRGSGAERWLRFSWWSGHRTASGDALGNIPIKLETTTGFLFNHHLDLRYAIAASGTLPVGFSETWQRIHEDAMRSAYCVLDAAHPEMERLPGWMTCAAEIAVGGMQRPSLAAGEGLYRRSLNAVGEWARRRGYVNYPGECAVRPSRDTAQSPALPAESIP